MDWKDYVERNPAFLLSDKKVRSLLSDVYMNDQLRVNLMMNAYSIGIITEMRESFPVDQFAVTRWTKRMVTDFGVSDDKAHWAVDTWVSAITPQVLRELDAAEQLLLVDEEAEQKRLEEEARLRAEEERLRREQEEQAREEARRATPDKRLRTKEDYGDYYINPKLEESEEYIYVPCGFGQADNGFLIYGIKKAKMCTHKDANVFALIYNYLVRNSSMTEKDIPHVLRDMDTVYELDYLTIYRLAITLLQMIRHNYMKDDTLLVNYTEDVESLKYAVRMINHYAALFCRLIHVPTVRLQVKRSASSPTLSLHKKVAIYVKDNKKVISNAREIWYGRKINYHLTKKDLPDLEYILAEISPFDGFKEGQFSALCDMLSCRKHAVCIMPTGSGKSLIFYLASLLQPLPMFVVSPTDILIEDQIRNLKKFHHMDNVAHLQLTEENSFAKWDVCNSLNYLTPMTFQNRHLLVKFRYLNSGTKLFGDPKVVLHEERIAPGALVSYVVLDEIHCLSNWGHDFRPEYLMLSKYLNKFFDHISFWGFTATANYTVVEDVQKQLDIPQQNFFSPIAFERFNVNYDFRAVHTEPEMLEALKTITAPIISKDERTIVFTKSDAISEKVADAIGYEADIFSKEDPTAYHLFADGKCKILVASDELGVGINLPNIRNIIHFGLPLSKNEYVQEIGRAGRANERVTSYILYLDNTRDNVPDGLLKRNTPIQNLPLLLTGFQNDYTDVYRKLSNGAISDDELYEQLLATYTDFVSRNKAMYVDSYPFETIETAKQHLYMLYLTGYVNDWYSYSQSKDGSGVDILVDICSTGYDSYRKDPSVMLNRMKTRMREYFEYMGYSRKSIAQTNRAKTPEELIRIYVKWYYEKYLYHHNEQFLDFYEFIEANARCDRDQITEEIKDYFVLPFAKLKSDEALYNELSLKEIIAKTTTGVSKKTLVNLERINSNRYSYKLDLALFCGHLRMNNAFDESRLERILSRLPDDEVRQLSGALSTLYPTCDTAAKIELLRYMEQNSGRLRTTYDHFLGQAYSSGQKDEVYYGIIASRLNKKFRSMRRASHV